jgi:DNA-binding NtrC family response regulator
MKKEGKLLIVDDDKKVLRSLEIFLDIEFEEVHTVSNPNMIPQLIRSKDFDVILLDMNFSAGINTGNEGLFWMREIMKFDPSAIVVLITAYGEVDLVIKAMKEGASDFVLKPWNNDKLISTLKAAFKLKRSNKEVKRLNQKKQQLSEEINKPAQKIIGSAHVMKKVYGTIRKVAKTNANILILGENGTGKELIAREIHRQSQRSGEALISVDMATLSESLFESELFGHVKGAFTDAKEDRAGRFETASGGSLFLDEIGNLPVSMQAKLLSALQNREITPLGSNKVIPVDIRLISATNKNLLQMIENGLFREDLLYRINTIQIEIPPLRERGDDIILLTEYYLKQYAAKYDKSLLKLNNKAVEKLLAYKWPGNVRELRHTVEKAVILSESNILSHDDFLLKNSIGEKEQWPLKMEDIEKQAIIRALKTSKGNQRSAARELGITRQTLYNKIKKYKL